jgi:hypothetical protein
MEGGIMAASQNLSYIKMNKNSSQVTSIDDHVQGGRLCSDFLV